MGNATEMIMELCEGEGGKGFHVISISLCTDSRRFGFERPQQPMYVSWLCIVNVMHIYVHLYAYICMSIDIVDLDMVL